MSGAFQFRPKGADSAMYAPHRDICTVFPKFAAQTAHALAERNWTGSLKDVADRLGLSEDDFAAAFSQINAMQAAVFDDPNADIESLLPRHACDTPAFVIVFAELGARFFAAGLCSLPWQLLNNVLPTDDVQLERMILAGRHLAETFTGAAANDVAAEATCNPEPSVGELKFRNSRLTVALEDAQRTVARLQAKLNRETALKDDVEPQD